MEQAGAQVNALSRPLDDATAALTSVRTDLAGVAVNVAGFTAIMREVAAQATSLGAAVSRIFSFSRRSLRNWIRVLRRSAHG